jgi:predicted ester cyclase
MSEDANKICVRRHFEELWNEGQIEKAGEFFHQDFMNFGEEHVDGISLVKRIVTVWRTAFPDFRFSIDAMMAENDEVMCEVSCRGTHLGEFQLISPLKGPSLSPNGKAFSVKHIHRFRLKDGKIFEHFAVRDDLGMFAQLGRLGDMR